MTFSTDPPRLLVALLVAFAICACGKSSEQSLAEARDALAAGVYSDALAAADAGLEGAPNDRTAWGLEIVILEAQARAGNGEAVKGQLEKLAAAHGDRLSATDYSSTAQQLQGANQKAAAIEVLDMGIKRFPDDAILARMIEDSVATGEDPAELEMLRSLGYIE